MLHNCQRIRVYICWAPKRHRPRAGTGTAFSPRAGTGTLTAPLWHRATMGRPVLEQGAPFRNCESNPNPKRNPNRTVPIWGRQCPSSSTGRKCGPSSSTGPVPFWGPTYITQQIPQKHCPPTTSYTSSVTYVTLYMSTNNVSTGITLTFSCEIPKD